MNKPDVRDLSFKPADGTRSKILTRQQIDQFNELGYCFPFKLFDDSAAADMRTYVNHLFELLAARGERDNYALLGYHTRCSGLYDLATNPTLLDHVEDLIGPDFVCWTSHAFCKLAHEPKRVPFHQDAVYWPLTPARTVSVWMAVDDSDFENSCLQVIPGTHKTGHFKHIKVKNDTVLDQEIADVGNLSNYGEPVKVELKAGCFSIHADMTAHGSDPNLSARRRCGFVIRYCPVTVRPLISSWGRNAILCRGNDWTGNWTHNLRPDGDDVGDWPTYWEGKFRAAGQAETDLSGGAIGA